MISSLTIAVLSAWPRDGAAGPAAAQVCQDNQLCSEYNEQALKLYEEKHYSEALQKFLLAYDVVPSVNLLLNIGRTLHFLKRYQEALDYYERYKNATQDKQETLNKFISQTNAALVRSRTLEKYSDFRRRAVDSLAENRFADALDAVLSAHESISAPELLILGGHVAYGLGLYPEANKAYERAAEYSENLSDAAARQLRGFREQSQGRLEAERGAAMDLPLLIDPRLQSEVELAPLCQGSGPCEQRIRDGLLAYAQRDYDKATEAFRGACGDNPPPLCSLAVGRALHRKGELRDALFAYLLYRQAMSLVPEQGLSREETARRQAVDKYIASAREELDRRQSLDSQGLTSRVESLFAASKEETMAVLVAEIVPLSPLPPQPSARRSVREQPPAASPQPLESRPPANTSWKLWLGIAGGVAGAVVLGVGGYYLQRSLSGSGSGSSGMTTAPAGGGSVMKYTVTWK